MIDPMLEPTEMPTSVCTTAGIGWIYDNETGPGPLLGLYKDNFQANVTPVSVDGAMTMEIKSDIGSLVSDLFLSSITDQQ